jgi:hypothetical protein
MTSSFLSFIYDQLTNFANLENFWTLFDTVFAVNYEALLNQGMNTNFAHIQKLVWV